MLLLEPPVSNILDLINFHLPHLHKMGCRHVLLPLVIGWREGAADWAGYCPGSRLRPLAIRLAPMPISPKPLKRCRVVVLVVAFLSG